MPLVPFLFLPALVAAPPSEAKPFPGFSFLLGRWVGVGDGPASGGEFTFEPALDGKVLLRRNTARLPGPDGKPAVHQDLMVIHGGDGGAAQADYYDNEGHVIRYAAEALADQVRFLSVGPGPRFRLTYLRTGEDTVEIRFEIAPPDKPEQFKLYLSGKAKRER